MRKISTLLGALIISLTSYSQLIATVQLDEPIEEMCGKTMYALFSGFEGQQGAECNLSEEELIALMNEKIAFSEIDPKAKGKGIANVFLNCDGKVIKADSGLKDEDSELANAIVDFLMNNGEWTPGIFNGDRVDCSETISIKVKKGVVYLNPL